MKLSFIEWIFGFATLTSLIFTFYMYIKQRTNINGLIGKLKTARNNLFALDNNATRIIHIIETKDHNDQDKIKIISELVNLIHQNRWTMTNSIDDGKDWGKMSIKQIHKEVCK